MRSTAGTNSNFYGQTPSRRISGGRLDVASFAWRMESQSTPPPTQATSSTQATPPPQTTPPAQTTAAPSKESDASDAAAKAAERKRKFEALKKQLENGEGTSRPSDASSQSVTYVQSGLIELLPTCRQHVGGGTAEILPTRHSRQTSEDAWPIGR